MLGGLGACRDLPMVLRSIIADWGRSYMSVNDGAWEGSLHVQL